MLTIWTEITKITYFYALLVTGQNHVPQEYSHISLREIRRVDVIWNGDEILIYNKLRAVASEENVLTPDYVKQIIKERWEK